MGYPVEVDCLLGLPGRAGSVIPPPPDSNTVSIAGSVSIVQEREDSSSPLNKLRRLEPSPLAGQVTTADSAAFTTTEPSAFYITAPNNAQPPSEPSEFTELKPSQLYSTAEIASVLTDESEKIPIAPPPTPGIRTRIQIVYSTCTCTYHAVNSCHAPAKPVRPSGYFDIPPRASATSDAENVTKVWANNSTENKQSLSSLGPSGSTGAGAPVLQSRKASRGSFQPHEREIAGSTYRWSNSSGIGMGCNPAQVVAVVSPADTIHVPERVIKPRDDTMIPAAEPAAMVLPPTHEVISSQPSRQPSGYNLGARTSDPMDYFGRSQDERRPLLSSRPSTPPIITIFPGHTASSSVARSYRSSGTVQPPVVVQPTPQWAPPARFDVNGSARNNYDYGSVRRPYAGSDWYKYVLHMGYDLDLRSHARLEVVERVMESVMENIAERQVPDGCEMWIRRSHKVSGWSRKKGATMGDLVVFWVDHRYRRVLNDAPTDGGALPGEEDCTGPMSRSILHMLFSQGSSQEAAGALHWSYTDRLLSRPQPIQPPLSQEECQELLRLLNEPTIYSVVHAHGRPRSSTRRTLGSSQFQTAQTAPARHYRRAHFKADPDEGNASTQSSAPLFVVGACTCLVSIVILSASVTLISFPGLDSIARIGGLVAISCSVLSMGSVAVHHAAAAAREGFVFLPRRSILLSLLLVFLAYSVSGFITGVVVYSFRTATINFAHAGMPAVAVRFDEYARWMVVGILGVLTGVLIASVVVSKR
ncbi:hypothetical protein EDC04DRAFT_2599952 [Pisolithus marmoratus]|nr:hypothetical protein EDC04DRAFT_2599952 [Pisolithus marmoratus]